MFLSEFSLNINLFQNRNMSYGGTSQQPNQLETTQAQVFINLYYVYYNFKFKTFLDQPFFDFENKFVSHFNQRKI